ncbi:MAG: urate hydroxylase PuuD [Elusimicrobiota bacterium]
MVHLATRWLHVIAGIVWIGHLYFFNFVNVPFQASLDDAAKKAVNAKLLLRALWWFRWGAMTTFVSGWALFTLGYMHTPGLGFGPSVLFSDENGMTSRAVWILIGMAMASIMWFNVWFIIWPAQKKMLAGQSSAEELPALRRKAYLASRTNTYLSGPMLFAMLAPAHFTHDYSFNIMAFVICSALAVAGAYWAIRASGKVGTIA